MTPQVSGVSVPPRVLQETLQRVAGGVRVPASPHLLSHRAGSPSPARDRGGGCLRVNVLREGDTPSSFPLAGFRGDMRTASGTWGPATS